MRARPVFLQRLLRRRSGTSDGHAEVLLWRFLTRKEPFGCRRNSAPLFDCFAQKLPANPQTECADVWLGPDCDPTDAPHNSVEVPRPGALANCKGFGTVDDAPHMLGDPYKYGVSYGRCPDGHAYDAICTLRDACDLDCTCTVDGTTTSTPTVSGARNVVADLVGACGW